MYTVYKLYISVSYSSPISFGAQDTTMTILSLRAPMAKCSMRSMCRPRLVQLLGCIPPANG